MFRKLYAHSDHKCSGCLQYVMIAVAPDYLTAPSMDYWTEEPQRRLSQKELQKAVEEELLRHDSCVDALLEGREVLEELRRAEEDERRTQRSAASTRASTRASSRSFHSQHSVTESQHEMETKEPIMGRPGPPLVDGLLDDILEARFGIIKQMDKQLTDAEVEDWFGDKADGEFAAQFANGTARFFLLCRRNALSVARELAKFHNRISQIRTGRPSIYASLDVVAAERDIRLFFPTASHGAAADLQRVRSYAASHIVTPLVRELAGIQFGGMGGEDVQLKTVLRRKK